MIPADWIYGLIGGLMIGTAAAMFLLINGRIMGASGILGSIIDGSAGSKLTQNMIFVLGVIFAPLLITLIFGLSGESNLTSNIPTLIIAGLCVGFGTRMANGCTSGHGVCGISRFSKRGIIATITYLGFGFAAMFLFRHVLGVI